MAVQLGLRGRDELLILNLHEKAHGPHGLMAGTTGSGNLKPYSHILLH